MLHQLSPDDKKEVRAEVRWGTGRSARGLSGRCVRGMEGVRFVGASDWCVREMEGVRLVNASQWLRRRRSFALVTNATRVAHPERANRRHESRNPRAPDWCARNAIVLRSVCGVSAADPRIRAARADVL